MPSLVEIPMRCKDGVLLETMMEKHSVNCLVFEQNTQKPNKIKLYKFIAGLLHWQENEDLKKRNFQDMQILQENDCRNWSW